MSKSELRELQSIADIIMGQSPESESYNDKGEGLPFYQGNADFGEIHPKTRMYCSRPKKIAQVDDILLSVRAPIGAINIAHQGCCIGRGLAAIRVSEYAATKYLYYGLRSKNNELNQKGTGSTFKAINKQNLSEIKLALPPLNIQKQIARELDTVSELLALRKKQLEELDQLIKSMFYEMFGNLVVNEKGWKESPITNVCVEIVDCVNKTAPISETVTPYKMIRTTNVKKGKVDTSEVKYVNEDVFKKWTRRSIPQKGDVLLTREAPIGEVGIIETDENVFLGQRLVSYRVRKEVLNEKYLVQLIQSPFFKKQINKLARGSTVKHLSVPECSKFEILLPPVELQNKFAELTRNIDEQMKCIKQSIKETQLLFDSLMSKYFDD